MKVRGVLGGYEGDMKKITLLNCTVRHGQTMNGLAIPRIGGRPEASEARGNHHGNARSETYRGHQDTAFTRHQTRRMDEVDNADKFE